MCSLSLGSQCLRRFYRPKNDIYLLLAVLTQENPPTREGFSLGRLLYQVDHIFQSNARPYVFALSY